MEGALAFSMRYNWAAQQLLGGEHAMIARRIAFGLLLWSMAVAPSVQAQILTSQPPSVSVSDNLNGVAASDVAGGLFLQGDHARPIPAVSFSIPTAFGAGWRDVYAAAGAHVGYNQNGWFKDGAVYLGAGLGNSRRLVGFETTLALIDLAGDTFDERTLSVKLHRRLGDNWAVAAGIENMIIAGRAHGGRSVYGVVSGFLPLQEIGPLRGELTMTVGVGDGRFNGFENMQQGTNTASMFGGIALRVLSAVSVFGSWTGQDLNAGVSWAPFADLPLVITPVLLNVDGEDGHGARFALCMGIGSTL